MDTHGRMHGFGAIGGVIAVTVAAATGPVAMAEGFRAAQVAPGVLQAPPQLTQQAINHVTSNRPGTFNGLNINAFLGADRFYAAGYDGDGTIAANVEAGHVWNGHESLRHVNNFVNDPGAFGTTTSDLFDRHATWVGQLIGGRQTPGGGPFQTGLAPGTDLRSGALATSWDGSAYALGFGFNGNAFRTPYSAFFGTADVINSSWGFQDPAATNFFAVALDGYANQNPGTTFVTSAGNSNLDPVLGSPDSVGAPAAGYNNIAVAALGGANGYDVVAGF